MRPSSMIPAILLAAGRGARMGGGKLLRELDGEPLVARTARVLLEGGVESVIAITGWDAARTSEALAALGGRVRMLHNPAFHLGRARSVRAGVLALPRGTDGVLVCPADLPCLAPRLVRAVLAAFQRARRPVVPAWRGITGHPVAFPARWFPRLMALRGEGNLRAALGREAERVPWPHPAAWADADTPLDALRTGLRVPERSP